MSMIETKITIDSWQPAQLRAFAEMLIKFAEVEELAVEVKDEQVGLSAMSQCDKCGELLYTRTDMHSHDCIDDEPVDIRRPSLFPRDNHGADEQTNAAIAAVMPPIIQAVVDRTNGFTEEELTPIETPREKTAAEIFGTPNHEANIAALKHGFANPDFSKAPPPLVSCAEVDADGLPWDSRIHSRTKSKMKDGRWKVQRGIDQNVLEQTEAELRGAIAAPAATIMSPPHAGVAVPPPPPVNAYVAFIPKVTKLISDKHLTGQKLAEILNSFGIVNLPALNARHDLIPQIEAAIAAHAGVTV